MTLARHQRWRATINTARPVFTLDVDMPPTTWEQSARRWSVRSRPRLHRHGSSSDNGAFSSLPRLWGVLKINLTSKAETLASPFRARPFANQRPCGKTETIACRSGFANFHSDDVPGEVDGQLAFEQRSGQNGFAWPAERLEDQPDRAFVPGTGARPGFAADFGPGRNGLLLMATRESAQVNADLAAGSPAQLGFGLSGSDAPSTRRNRSPSRSSSVPEYPFQ